MQHIRAMGLPWLDVTERMQRLRMVNAAMGTHYGLEDLPRLPLDVVQIAIKLNAAARPPDPTGTRG